MVCGWCPGMVEGKGRGEWRSLASVVMDGHFRRTARVGRRALVNRLVLMESVRANDGSGGESRARTAGAAIAALPDGLEG